MRTEIGHEKAQSVIDSITASYSAEGQQNPMFQQPPMMPGPGGFPAFPPPFAGALLSNYEGLFSRVGMEANILV